MAIGLGLMLGFVFAKNFDSPYTSQSITEFWRRWHISLSTWLRDYLYVPLGGNRKGRGAHVRQPDRRHAARRALARRRVDLRRLGRHARRAAGVRAACWARRRSYGRLPAPLRVGLTFVVVLVSWVFFRATDSAVGGRLSRRDVRTRRARSRRRCCWPASSISRTTSARSCLRRIVTWTCPQTWDWTRTLTAPKAVVMASLFVLAMVVLTTQAYNPFIYFIF